MSNFTWTTKTSSNWDTTTNWGTTNGNPGGGTPDVDTAVLATTGSNYTVTVQAGHTQDLSSVSIGTTSGSTGPSLSISGILATDTLTYSAITGKTNNITINGGGELDVRTTLADTNNTAQTLTISGKSGGGELILGNTSTAVNSHVTDKFSDTSGTMAGGIIDFASGFTNGGTITQAIQGVAWGNEIIVTGASFAAGDTATLSGGVLTVKDVSSTTVLTFSSIGTLAKSAPTFVVSGDDIIAVCYARGTSIATPDGEVAVERLRAGKQVTTLVDGEPVARTVKWLGHRRIDLGTHRRPETVAPIRILKDAFADNMPHRDLLVSPDHAVFVDGKLIVARQLVNGTTIRQEAGWTAVDYYHVELEQHSILLAEGLPAESYIDTGNANFFANSGAPMQLHTDLTDESGYPTREAGSCAPFVWDEASVRPVWQSLADRAATIGKPVPQRATTAESELRIVAKGRSVKPVYSDSALAIFSLPRGATEVHLVSRAQSPTEARPWLEDRRMLGVRIARIVLKTADETREVPMDHPALAQGWWAIERDGVALRRWTDGDAVLPLPAIEGEALLEVHFGGAMTYVADERRAA